MEEKTLEKNIKTSRGDSHRRSNFTYGESEWEGDDHPMFEDEEQGEPSTKEGLRSRDLTAREPLQRFEEQPAQSIGGRGVKKMPIKPRGQWSNKALIAAIDALDDGYKIQDVSNNFGIPRSTLREHYVGKRKSRKIGPKGVLTMAEEASLVQYLVEMVRVSCPLNIT